LTWHKIDIRMRLRIGENARISRPFSPDSWIYFLQREYTSYKGNILLTKGIYFLQREYTSYKGNILPTKGIYLDQNFIQRRRYIRFEWGIYIDNNSALTWHKIDIRMRLRIGENARISRPFSPDSCRILLLLKIFSAKLLFIFKNLIRISMVYLPVHRSLKSWVLRLIILLRKISWGLLGVKSSLQKFVNTIVSFPRILCFSSITDNTFTELDYIYR
jgi:hypothetical protein